MADTYGDLAGADAYHTARGNAGWTGTEADKNAALLRASVYVDSFAQRQIAPGVYAATFSGTRVGGRAQVRQWPRTGATDAEGLPIASDSVPIEVVYATYEAALRELVAPGSLNPDYVPATAVKRERVDVLEVEYATPATAADGSPPTRPIVSVILDLLAPLFSSQYAGPTVYVV